MAEVLMIAERQVEQGTFSFRASDAPDADQLRRIAATAPENPYYTAEYGLSRRSLGWQVVAFSSEQGGHIHSGCPAFLRRGRLGCALEIHSVPVVPDAQVFWSGLRDFAKQKRVTTLFINSSASRAAAIPDLGEVVSRRNRCEYVIDLTVPDLWSGLSSSHRRHVKKAPEGLHMEIRTDDAACKIHFDLMNQSLLRRQKRGEDVTFEDRIDTYRALLNSGAGKLFQAIKDEQVFSSLLVLLSSEGAYYHSAGSSPEGMECNASPFLVYSIAQHCKEIGLKVFNLGGTGVDEDAQGLRQFKSGFGARRVDLESASFYVGGRLKKKLLTGLRLLRSEPKKLLHVIAGSPEESLVFRADPSTVQRQELPPGIEFRKLTEEELLQLSSTDPFHKEVERFRKFGFNGAYGLLADSRVVHISWLVPAAYGNKAPDRNSKLENGEAEITGSATIASWRGKGLYPIAIGEICAVAAQQGIVRVYLFVEEKNLSSKRAIEKAGIPCVGRTTRYSFRYISSKLRFTVVRATAQKQK